MCENDTNVVEECPISLAKKINLGEEEGQRSPRMGQGL